MMAGCRDTSPLLDGDLPFPSGEKNDHFFKEDACAIPLAVPGIGRLGSNTSLSSPSPTTRHGDGAPDDSQREDSLWDAMTWCGFFNSRIILV